MKALAGLVVLLAAAGSAAAQTNCGELPKSWAGQAYAASGDTLGGIGLKPRVRLWGIRAPELAADPSMAAMRA